MNELLPGLLSEAADSLIEHCEAVLLIATDEDQITYTYRGNYHAALGLAADFQANCAARWQKVAHDEDAG
jgi:hypothetical protein